jgi:hypothetical protein
LKAIVRKGAGHAKPSPRQLPSRRVSRRKRAHR